MVLSSWICTSSPKNMLVKIVHPGGHVELHDKPVLAAEIMLRNPRCVIAHPHVFQKPWAIVSADTTLTLGHKFYVVPISTIRKLQRLSYKFSAASNFSSPSQAASSESSMNSTTTTYVDDNEDNCCFSMFHNAMKQYCDHDNNHGGKSNTKNCFVCLLAGMKIKAVAGANSYDRVEETSRSSTTSGSSEAMRLRRNKRRKVVKKGSPKRFTSMDYWQPSLESIREE